MNSARMGVNDAAIRRALRTKMRYYSMLYECMKKYYSIFCYGLGTREDACDHIMCLGTSRHFLCGMPLNDFQALETTTTVVS